MDERTRTLVKAVISREKLRKHKCSKKWCPHHDIGCDEAQELCSADEYAHGDALEMIQKLGWDEEI